MRFFNYHALLSSQGRRGLREVREDHIAEIESSLVYLAQILGNVPNWCLTGGLSIDCHNGTITREHDDIDLGVRRESLAQLIAAAKREKYVLVKRIAMAHVPGTTRKLDIFQTASVQAAQHSASSFRLARTERGEIVPKVRLLDRIDIYVHHIREDGWMYCHRHSKVYPRSYEDTQSVLIGRESIELRSLSYMRRIKAEGKDPKDVHDLKIIDDLSTA